MIRSQGLAAVVAIGALASVTAGCFLYPAEPEVPPPPPPKVLSSPVTVTATPAFRLIVDPQFADAPSRLLVLYARVEARGNDKLHFDPAQMHFVLSGKRRGEIFDAPRAAVLLEQTELGRWGLDYSKGPAHAPSGFDKDFRTRLKEKIREALMTPADFGPGHPLTGYLVADTGVPVTSLENAALEIVTTRVRDLLEVRTTYQFASHKVLDY